MKSEEMTPAQKLKKWRTDNPEKLALQRVNYAPRAAAARAEWRRVNRDAEREAALARRRGSLAYRISKRYGVGIAEARDLVAKMPRHCEICAMEEKLNFDHDHSTGAHRGWLCGSCNWGIGHFKDDPARMRAAAKYVERSRSTS